MYTPVVAKLWLRAATDDWIELQDKNDENGCRSYFRKAALQRSSKMTGGHEEYGERERV